MPRAKKPSPARAREVIVIEDHLEWAAAIARGVAGVFRFARASFNTEDLIQTAHFTLARCARAFQAEMVPDGGDPAGQLRGFSHRFIQSECRREARRMLNGGTYRTRRGENKLKPVIVDAFSIFEDGIDIPDGRDTNAGDVPMILPGTASKRDFGSESSTWSPCWTPGCDDED